MREAHPASPKYASTRAYDSMGLNSTSRSKSLSSLLKSSRNAEPNTSSRATPKREQTSSIAWRLLSSSPITDLPLPIVYTASGSPLAQIFAPDRGLNGQHYGLGRI